MFQHGLIIYNYITFYFLYLSIIPIWDHPRHRSARGCGALRGSGATLDFNAFSVVYHGALVWILLRLSQGQLTYVTGALMPPWETGMLFALLHVATVILLSSAEFPDAASQPWLLKLLGANQAGATAAQAVAVFLLAEVLLWRPSRSDFPSLPAAQQPFMEANTTRTGLGELQLSETQTQTFGTRARSSQGSEAVSRHSRLPSRSSTWINSILPWLRRFARGPIFPVASLLLWSFTWPSLPTAPLMAGALLLLVVPVKARPLRLALQYLSLYAVLFYIYNVYLSCLPETPTTLVPKSFTWLERWGLQSFLPQGETSLAYFRLRLVCIQSLCLTLLSTSIRCLQHPEATDGDGVTGNLALRWVCWFGRVGAVVFCTFLALAHQLSLIGLCLLLWTLLLAFSGYISKQNCGWDGTRGHAWVWWTLFSLSTASAVLQMVWQVLATETYPQLGLTRELPQAANFVMLSALAAVQVSIFSFVVLVLFVAMAAVEQFSLLRCRSLVLTLTCLVAALQLPLRFLLLMPRCQSWIEEQFPEAEHEVLWEMLALDQALTDDAKRKLMMMVALMFVSSFLCKGYNIWTQGHVETVQWSDQWEEELKTKIHGTEGCTITNQRGTRLHEATSGSGVLAENQQPVQEDFPLKVTFPLRDQFKITEESCPRLVILLQTAASWSEALMILVSYFLLLSTDFLTRVQLIALTVLLSSGKGWSYVGGLVSVSAMASLLIQYLTQFDFLKPSDTATAEWLGILWEEKLVGPEVALAGLGIAQHAIQRVAARCESQEQKSHEELVGHSALMGASIKLRPLMEVPVVVHGPQSRSEGRPTTGSSFCHDSSRLPTPSSARGKAPFFGTEIFAKSGCDHSPRRPWVVHCPKDCPCRRHARSRPVQSATLPKWWMEWQAKGLASEKITSQELNITSEDTFEELPLFGTGSASLSLSNKLFPVGHPGTPEPSKIISNVPFCDAHEWAMPFHAHARDGDASRYKHHKSNVRPPKVFLPRAKTTGPRELNIAASPRMHDLEEEHMPHTWNRVVSEGGALALAEAENTWERQRTERRHSDMLGFDTIVSMAKKHGIPAQEVRQCADEFRAMDTNRDGRLSMQEFEVMVRQRCDLPPHEPLPATLGTTMQKAVEKRPDGTVGFEDFLLWVWQCIFMEEMSATDLPERQQRSLARELGLDLPKLESLRELFNNCDDDRSGFIEWPEFDQLVRCLLDAKEATDVSEALLRRYWSEVNDASSDCIGFPDFVRWYAKNFA
ncbi:unnamed protein product [Cladocopium goreaui]|uniref:EF-hand domain-containing protein n=1 Tax=Cladocopium goreaui TaxID=2562237 RepID=A0A9P1GCQ0_9DINO|nr:unnamed protein product [Cladocopium goreaui]